MPHYAKPKPKPQAEPDGSAGVPEDLEPCRCPVCACTNYAEPDEEECYECMCGNHEGMGTDGD